MVTLLFWTLNEWLATNRGKELLFLSGALRVCFCVCVCVCVWEREREIERESPINLEYLSESVYTTLVVNKFLLFAVNSCRVSACIPNSSGCHTFKCVSVAVGVCNEYTCAPMCKKSFFRQLTQISLQLNPKGTCDKINSLSQFELFPQVNSVLSHHRRYFCLVMTNLL